MTQGSGKTPAVGEQHAAPTVAEPVADEVLAFQPGHVMQREHYERMAHEAAQK